ncbi:MAG: hypothetical protein EU536_01395 [Promethearchaeota archaeon]|nr:MAG: hypothetical protein EU536_01395 [Candidatus Lokiarchaeota archaeon]
MWKTPIGILLGLFAGFMFTIGAIYQKKGVETLADIKMSDYKTITPLLKNRTWLFGAAIGSLGGVPYVLSQLWVGIGNTQLLIAVGLILLAVMASRMLKEPLGPIEYIGIGLIVGGTVFLGLANLQRVEIPLTEPGFFNNAVIFYTPFFIAIAIGLIFYKLSDWGAAKILAALSGIIFGCGAGFSQIGIMGLTEGNVLALVLGYLILLAGTVLGTVVANVAFQKGKAILVIPIQSSGNYLIPVVAGLTLFQQIFEPSINFWIFFLPSVVLILIGVILLSRIQAKIEKPIATEDKP